MSKMRFSHLEFQVGTHSSIHDFAIEDFQRILLFLIRNAELSVNQVNYQF